MWVSFHPIFSVLFHLALLPSFPHQHQVDLAQSDGIHSVWREGDLRTLLIRVPPWPLYEEAHHDGEL